MQGGKRKTQEIKYLYR